MVIFTSILLWDVGLDQYLLVHIVTFSVHNVYIVQFFSPRPSAVGYIVQPHTCHIIEHIFVPTRSVEGNIEKIRFSWVSNSKFVIFPQIYPCSNYKIFPNVPLLFPVSNGDSPVVTTFPRSNYRGFLTTGESYCTMYTLCSGHVLWLVCILLSLTWNYVMLKSSALLMSNLEGVSRNLYHCLWLLATEY